jgi:hypothetical protein
MLLLDCRDPAELTIAVSTDAKCSDVGSTTITVGHLNDIETQAATSSTTACNPSDGSIGTLVITPSGSDTDLVAFKVVTGIRQGAEQCTAPDYKGCIVARRAIQYIPHTPLRVDVPMDLSCLDVPCGATNTCVNGNCVPATVPNGPCASSGGCGPPDAGPPGDTAADEALTDGPIGDTASGDVADTLDAAEEEAAADAPADTSSTDGASDAATDAGDAGCGNTTMDPANCGSCGHSCLGGACIAGACQPVVVAPGQTYPRAIAVDANNIYWTQAMISGSVMQQAIAGGATITLASSQHQPWLVAVSAGFVFWTNYGPSQTVNKVPIGGGTITALATGQSNPAGIAADANNVYWTNARNNSTVWQVSIGGGVPLALAPSNHPSPWAVAVDATSVYWVDYGNGSSAYAVPIGGGTQTTLATTALSPYDIAAYGPNIYFTAWTSVSNGMVLGAAKAGGASTMLASGLSAPTGVAVDASGVYVVENGAGNVDFVPLAGGSMKVLVTGLSGPRSITTDATSIYWTNDGGDVLRLAK